jgi:hypothetical protein
MPQAISTLQKLEGLAGEPVIEFLDVHTTGIKSCEITLTGMSMKNMIVWDSMPFTLADVCFFIYS